MTGAAGSISTAGSGPPARRRHQRIHLAIGDRRDGIAEIAALANGGERRADLRQHREHEAAADADTAHAEAADLVESHALPTGKGPENVERSVDRRDEPADRG